MRCRVATFFFFLHAVVQMQLLFTRGDLAGTRCFDHQLCPSPVKCSVLAFTHWCTASVSAVRGGFFEGFVNSSHSRTRTHTHQGWDWSAGWRCEDAGSALTSIEVSSYLWHGVQCWGTARCLICMSEFCSKTLPESTVKSNSYFPYYCPSAN